MSGAPFLLGFPPRILSSEKSYDLRHPDSVDERVIGHGIAARSVVLGSPFVLQGQHKTFGLSIWAQYKVVGVPVDHMFSTRIP